MKANKPRTLKYKRDQLLLRYLVLIISFLAVLGALLFIGSQKWGLWIFCAWMGTIFLTLAVLVASFALVVLAYKLIKRDGFVILAFTGIFVFGVAVYYIFDEQTLARNIAKDGFTTQVDILARVLSPMNNTLSIFFPSRGDTPIVEGGSWEYQLAHLFAYIFAAATLISLFGRKAFNKICIHFIRKKDFGIKNVFWGYSEDSLLLASDIVENDKNCRQLIIFALYDEMEMDNDSFKPIFENIDRIGGIIYTYPKDDDSPSLQKARFRKLSACRHFFMTDDQNANVGLSMRLIESIQDNPSAETGIYLRSEVENIGALYTKYSGKKIQLHLVNYSDSIAREFVIAHPIIDAVEKKPDSIIDYENCTVKGEFNILVIGMGYVGLEIIKKSLCDGQFLGDFKLTITAIDKDYDSAHGWYESIFETFAEPYKEAFNQRYHIDINPLFKGERVSEVNSTLFYEWLDHRTSGIPRILGFDRIVISLGDDTLSIDTALHLHSFRLRRFVNEAQLKAKERIYVNIKNSINIRAYDDERFVAVFGDMRNNVDGVLIDDRTDILAKLVNYIYSRQDINDKLYTKQDFLKAADDIQAQWPEYSFFNQSSSRAVAMNIRNTYKICGCISEHNTLDSDKFSIFLSDPEKLDLLAQMEHLRWNAFHFVNGVYSLRNGQPPVPNKVVFFNKSVTTHHDCLVPYEELTPSMKQVDKSIVKHFPSIYEMLK